MSSVAVCTILLAGALVQPAAQSSRGTIRFAPAAGRPLRQWDSRIDTLARDGELRLRLKRDDTVLGGRTHERFDQYYKGVRVFGGDATRQTDPAGVTVSVFGTWYDGISIDPEPALTMDQARGAVASAAGIEVAPDLKVELVVLPLDAGGYALAYRARAFGPDGLFMYFIDARTGAVLLRYNDLKTQAAIGAGAGVLGDQKKLSVTHAGTTYRTIDAMRPPALVTFDLRGNLAKALNFFNGLTSLTTVDVASDTDNTWSDPVVVDAHAYGGWVYDYYYKRFGRRGLDNADIPIASIVHPVNRNDIVRQPASVVGTFYLNAAYVGDGVIYYGEGLPTGFRDSGGHSWNYLAGGIDVIGHELTHGVTDYSSQLIYRNESGALNEAFSDIMGTSVEFFFQPPGDGLQKADYLIGEDVVTPGGLRSMKNPIAFGDPDHYSIRYLGPEDNGGVHTNSGIANQAFYLAIEGGTNRVSGITVQGVGAANREQMEKVFYRAFTQLMPANATFAVARATTLQAARDLYGAGSAPERAVAAAWTAVGVN